MYGVNHEASGKASFASFTVYGADIWNGVGGVTSDQYPGTADTYLLNNPNAKYFYAYNISRKSSGKNCFTIPGPGLQGYGIEMDQPIFIAFRHYLEPSTKTGPVAEEVLFDRVIKFSPKK